MLTSINSRVKRIAISKMEILILSLLLAFGLPMVLLIPPGAGYDEEDHLVRVWEISAFSFIPAQMSPRELQYPTLFRDLAYRQQAVAGILDTGFWQNYGGISLYERGYVRRELNTKSVYPPALLLPQALTMRYFGRIADLPALPVFYLCRFAGFLSYAILAWLAVRWMPFGNWILLVLAASPMALFQAATLTADTISNGIGFLFIAGCLRIAEWQEISWKEWGRIAFLIFLLFLAKFNLVPLILLPFLLIPPSRFTKRRMFVLLSAIAVILFILQVAAWTMILSARYQLPLANDAVAGAQLRYILANPLRFLQILINDLIANGLVYFQGWINGYGYYYWTPPQLVSLFFLLGLGAAVLIASHTGQISRRHRIVFVLVFVAGYLATVLPLYTTFTPVGSQLIFGVQGRYLIPLVLPLILALSGFSWIKRIAAPLPGWTAGFLTLALSLNLLGIFLSFHVPCGTTLYQTGLCYQPLYHDYSSGAQLSPLSDEVSLTQEIYVACDGLTELRILLIPPAQAGSGSTRFVLQDPSGDETLIDHSIPHGQISEEDWYRLRFDPDWHSSGKRYILKVISSDIPAGKGVKVLYAAQPEINLGSLYENGEAVQGNIVLQYGCMTGLRKLWLTGKP